MKHQVKPGITGLAQVNGFRGDTSIKKRIEFDIQYIENWTILMDITILFRTAFKGFKNNEKIIIKNDTLIENNDLDLKL
ncbi:UDP-glucose:undecaprenyl-phosphate glucose-1-phosphate transferase [Clostridium beijerinckii]|nr:UDP-glucose:undecaprenyl-phosphate glucose-1-phosphate transferase [Clostridium beijerinckii]